MSRQILDRKAQLLMTTSLGETSEKDKRHAKTERLSGSPNRWHHSDRQRRLPRLPLSLTWGEAARELGAFSTTYCGAWLESTLYL